MKFLQKVLAYVIGFIAVSWIGYMGTQGMGNSLSSQAHGSQINGIGSFFGYLIVGLLKIVLMLLLAIPGTIWVAVFEHKERTALAIVVCCAGAWLLLAVLSTVNFRAAGASFRAAGSSTLRAFVRFAQHAYYNTMEIILRPKPTQKRTNERRFNMPDPSEFINVETSDGNRSAKFRATLVKFQQHAKDVLPDIPNLPIHSSEYEGWFAQTKKIIAMRKQTMAANQQLDLVRSFTNLYAEYHNLSEVLLKIQKNKNEMEREKERSNLLQMQIEVERLQLEAQKTELQRTIAANQAEIDKLSKPAPVSPIDKLKQDVEEARLRAELQVLRTPPQPPKPQTPIEKLEQELAPFKTFEEWKKTWPADLSEEERAARERIYNSKRLAFMERIKT